VNHKPGSRCEVRSAVEISLCEYDRSAGVPTEQGRSLGYSCLRQTLVEVRMMNTRYYRLMRSLRTVV